MSAAVHVPRVSRLDDQVHPRTETSRQQPLMHGAEDEQHRDGHARRVYVSI
jgi:hypothetical protein